MRRIMNKKPVVLVIMDGLGLRDSAEGNAVKAAKTPVLGIGIVYIAWYT